MTFTRRTFIQSATLAATLASTTSSWSQIPQSDLKDKWKPRKLTKKPNIMIVVLDDVGFGDLGCYGSDIKTTCIDKLATNGVRYNNFHVTALCAPTRACLLTGRNAHAVGVGNIAEWGRDLPGYKGWIRQDAATLAEILRPMGYSALSVGKWHLTPLQNQNAVGPFAQWPTGRGFDKWYGFHGSAMDHFHPELIEGTSEVNPDKGPDYHLSADLVDRSMSYISDHRASRPDDPFFMYLAFGACHFPFHVPEKEIEKYKGRYDNGWDQARKQRFEKQKVENIIPDHAKLSSRNPNVPAWDDMPDDHKIISARYQETYAAFLDHTDQQLERLVAFLEKENELDDTIIIVMSDNGAAYGGVRPGILDVRRNVYIEPETTEDLINDLDLVGTSESSSMYSLGWGQVGNSPLKWFKGDTYEGGTHAPFVMHWPNGNIGNNEIRGQYMHAIDVVPTLLEMINEKPPETINGERALPIQGTSFAYTLDNAEAPTQKKVQYFETSGDRAIWANGWKAVSQHKMGDDFRNDIWELYHTDQDFSETKNLAEAEPEKLKTLQELWFMEAKRYDILPMDDDLDRLFQDAVPEARAHYVFYPNMSRLDRLSAPDIYNYDSQLKADINITDENASGVIVASGDTAAGYELFMQNGHVIFTYVFTRNEVFTFKSDKRMPIGNNILNLDIQRGDNSTRKVSIKLANEDLGELILPNMWQIYAVNAGLRCGENRGAPISKAYDGTGRFSGGTINRVTVDLIGIT